MLSSTCRVQFRLPFVFPMVVRFYRNRNLLNLRERNFWENVFPEEDASELAEILASKPQTIYAGIDSTESSLHLGHLPLLMSCLHAQIAGHHVVLVIGEATARLGDPSGRMKERAIIAEDAIRKNGEALSRNLRKIFGHHEEDIWLNDPEGQKSPLRPVTILSNREWYADLEVTEYLTKYGKFLKMNELLSRSTIKRRLETERVSLTFKEFLYQSFQAFDWFQLYKKYNCCVQLGGSDQDGNILTGCDFIRRITNGEARVYGLTWPLVMDVVGQKMGKTSGNAVWLEQEKTSPFELYQYFLRVSDTDVRRQLELFTFLSLEEIEDLMYRQGKEPEKRIAQNMLAAKVVTLVHGLRGLGVARKTTQALYQQDPEALLSLSADDLTQTLKGTKQVELPLLPGLSLLEVTLKARVFSWEKHAREIIESGGLLVNNIRIQNPESPLVAGEHILPSGISLFRVGKKNFTLVRWRS